VTSPPGGGAIIAGKYRLLSILGRAANTVTFEAELVNAGATRVRFALRATPAPDDAALGRLTEEAQGYARRVHAGLPRFVEHVVGELNGKRASCIVRELPDAESLAWLVARRGPVPEAEATRIGRALLELLAYLHEQRVFPNAIAPETVLRTNDGRVLVVDHGEPPRGANDAQMPARFDYRAPEATRGEAVAASDLYAVGGVLAFLLAGRAPPDATQLRAYARAGAKSPRIAEWLAKLLAESPAERFLTAQAALDALRGGSTPGGVAPPKSVPRSWIYAGAGAGGLLVIVLAVSMTVSRCQAQKQEQLALAEEAKQLEQRRSEARQAASRVGCADGTREAFRDVLTYPDIAGCAGAFTVPGINVETAPSCERAAGNDGANVMGNGCAASDLCAAGFHVCRSAADVGAHSRNGCSGANDAPSGTFFATRQSGPGCSQCATGDDPGCDSDSCRAGCAQTPTMANDIFGCGTMGKMITSLSCAPLTRASDDLCRALPSSWHCRGGGATAVKREAAVVAKPESTGGGVLCCAD
jgi:hypothetical protein